MRILITVEYYGKNYAGWQRQKNALAVQQVLEEKLSLILQSKVILVASGRTDRGVNAYAQKAHFDYDGFFPVQKIAYSVNTTLPDDIRVLSAIQVPDDFHAQYSAKKKTYLYKMYFSKTLHPLKNLLSTQIPYENINFENMEIACRDLIGTHDFAAFAATGSHITNTVRTVFDAKITKNGEDAEFEITGNGFLYNMVRIAVGTLVWIGIGKLPVTAVKEMLLSGDRTKGGKTLAPHGLYLKSVHYDGIDE